VSEQSLYRGSLGVRLFKGTGGGVVAFANMPCTAGRVFPAQWNGKPSATASRKLHLQRIETPHSCVRGVPRHNLLESSSVLPSVERANVLIYAATHALRVSRRAPQSSACVSEFQRLSRLNFVVMPTTSSLSMLANPRGDLR
jgi:hypothetical protein